MIRLKRCLKREKNQKQIENVPNSVNPNFYRRCHLEFARQFTLKSQGGYIGAFYLNLSDFTFVYQFSSIMTTLKAGLSEDKIGSYAMSKDTFKCFVLNALCSKAKQLRIVLRHGIRPDFLEIHLL